MFDILAKFSSSPGSCSLAEIKKVEKFILDYKEKHDIFVAAFGHSPQGLFLDSFLDNIEWYKIFKESIK